MYFQWTACWSALRYSHLVTPSMHLCCNWYTVLLTEQWLWAQTIAVKMIFKWFLQDMDIMDSTVITQPPPCRLPSIITHLSATVVAFCFNPNSHLYCPKALKQIVVVMWKSYPNYASFHVLIWEMRVLAWAGAIWWSLDVYKAILKPCWLNSKMHGGLSSQTRLLWTAKPSCDELSSFQCFPERRGSALSSSPLVVVLSMLKHPR